MTRLNQKRRGEFIKDGVDRYFGLCRRAGLFDTIVGMCNDAGFSPRVEYEADRVQTVLSLVEAEEGVSIVPACVRKLWSNGVRFFRLQPDDVRVDFVAAWRKERPSVVLRSFLDLVDAEAPHMRKKAELF